MDIESSSWSESASQNTLTPPDAFRGGMNAGLENDTFREVMAAVKREYNRSHPTLTLGVGSNSAWSLTPATAISEYVHGQIFAAYFGITASATRMRFPTLAVSGKAAKLVYIQTSTGLVNPQGLLFAFNGMPIFFYYDSTLNSGSGGFVMWSLLAKYRLTESIDCPITSETGAVSAGAGLFTFRLPVNFTFTEVRASLQTAQTSGSLITIDVNANGTSLFSTRLTFDNGEKTTTTAATPAVITDNNLSLAPYFGNDTEITIDVDQIGDGTAKGLKVYLVGHQA